MAHQGCYGDPFEGKSTKRSVIVMASADVPSLKMERGLSKPNIKFLSNQPYDEVLEIEKDTPAMLSPLTDLAEKTLEDVDDSGKILSDSLSNKSGIPRSTSRPASRPLSRPTPSARVRALGKGELEEVDQNSGDDDEEDDDDDEEEDEDQGIQVEGLFPKTFAARARYASNQTRHRSESSIEKQVQDFKFLSRKMRDKLSPVSPTSLWTENLSLSDCSICDDILHETKYDMLEDERDLQYLDLPYDHKRAYDPADFEHLTVSSEMKELFQYITRYTPQTIELDHKLRPFIPEFIPAVGDIDAFIKVPRPDDEPDKFGLIALDEPCAKQSDPTVLDLQLRAISKETTYKAMAVKSLENADKKPKEIDAWINSIANLHRSKPPPTVHYSKNMPDIETLMQEWPPEFEEKLNEVGLPSADLDCSLEEYVEIVCGILDIPVYKSKVQSLHVLFTLYSEFKNSQHFKSLAMNNELDNSLKTGNPNEQTDHLVIRD